MEANQELSAANASLRSVNEELLLGHEEAQAAMEEVETLNEELQATNEEQETLNEELQATVEELNTTNDDLHARSIELQDLAAVLEAERSQLRAVLASMSEALLVVDASGRVLLVNNAFERLFGEPNSLPVTHRPAPPEGRLDYVRHVAAQGERFQTRFRHRLASGATKEFEARGEPVRGGRQSCVVTIHEV
jgi:two-component system CheB/CheR fusion protein